MATSSAHTCLHFHPSGLSVCLCVFVLRVCVCPSIEDTCIELTRAIEAGDTQSASDFAATLARQRAALKIQPSAKDYEDTETK